MAAIGKPSMQRRATGPTHPTRGYVPADSMKQGAFQHVGGAIPVSPDESMHQGKRERPGKITVAKVPRVQQSMKQ